MVICTCNFNHYLHYFKSNVMKTFFYIIFFSILFSCSSTRLVDSWKNPNTMSFHPEKLLVVGMTNHLNARMLFEQKLVDELSYRGINAEKSLNIFDPNFTHNKKSEEDIQQLVKILRAKGFDAVLVTAIRGVERKKIVKREYYDIHYKRFPFRRYYLTYQDIYYQPAYYDEYKIYHLETSLYNIHTDDVRSLIWIGYIDVVDPSDVTNTVNDYVKEIITSLEKEGLIGKL